MTAKKVEPSRLRGKMPALQWKRRFVSVEVLADILAAVVLAEQILDLERQVTKREQALVEVE